MDNQPSCPSLIQGVQKQRGTRSKAYPVTVNLQSLFFVLGTRVFCCCAALVVCLLAGFIPCGWFPFYSGGTSIIANPGLAVEAWRCFDLSNWCTELSKSNKSMRWRQKQERKICKMAEMLKMGGFHSVTSWIQTKGY